MNNSYLNIASDILSVVLFLLGIASIAWVTLKKTLRKYWFLKLFQEVFYG